MGGKRIVKWEVDLLKKSITLQGFMDSYLKSPEPDKRDASGILSIWKHRERNISDFDNSQPVQGPFDAMEGNLKIQQQMPLAVPVTYALGATIRTTGNQFLKFDVHGANSPNEAKQLLVRQMKVTTTGNGLKAAEEFIKENFLGATGD